MVDGYEPARGRPRHRAPSRSPAAPEMIAVEAGDVRDRRRRRAASPTTTSAPATRSSWPRSRSIEPRSPTPRTSSSWRRRAPSRRCTGSATASGGWLDTAMGRRAPIDPGAPGRPRLLGRGRRLRPLGGQAPADRARVGGGAPAAARASVRPGSGRPRTSCAYPGFEAFPYPEYSEVFFGDEHKVLRGGSWATAPARRPPQLPQLGPAAAAADLRRPALREGRYDRDRRPPRRRRRRDDGARRPRRPLRLPEGAVAEVLLRRARLAAVRADHRAARVLPDPAPSARSSASARPRSSPPRATPAPWSSSAPARPRRPATCSSAMRDAGSLETYVPVDISEEITHETAASLVDEYPGLDGPRPRLRLRAAPGADPATASRAAG